jgi:hypothetical protein
MALCETLQLTKAGKLFTACNYKTHAESKQNVTLCFNMLCPSLWDTARTHPTGMQATMRGTGDH